MFQEKMCTIYVTQKNMKNIRFGHWLISKIYHAAYILFFQTKFKKNWKKLERDKKNIMGQGFLTKSIWWLQG